MKIDPWTSVGIKDYEQITKDFGIEKFPSARMKDAPVVMRRGLVFGSRDFSRILSSIKSKKRFALLTGLMPSGKFHIGHKMLADQIIYYQGLGAEIFLLVADIEAYNMRGQSLKELRKTALEEYLINYIALGLKPKKCDFYFQSMRSNDAKKTNAYHRLIGLAARRVTANEFKAIYGNITPGKVISVFTQIADILHPQLPEFGGIKPVLVPVGADQLPHTNLSRDVASRMKEFNFVPPSASYHKFMKGLKGGKMSSSDPFSYIALTDSPKAIKEKVLKHAFSGGRDSVAEHRKMGGNTEVDVSFQMLYYMFEPNDTKIKKIKSEYESGALLTGELKQILIEKLVSFLERHQERREKAKDKVNNFL